MRARSVKSLVLAFLFSIVPAGAWADQHPNQARGFRADQSFQLGDLDHVNLFNGNLAITIPIGQRYPVNAQLSYGLTLTYGGNVWDVEDREEPGVGTVTRLIPGRDYNAGLGWMVSMGKLFGPLAVANNTGSWVYVSPDGAEHRFVAALHPGETPTTGVFYTRDGGYLRLRTLQAPSPPTRPEVEFPDGAIHAFESLPGDEYRIAEMRDRFANAVTVSYPDAVTWQIADVHGRTQTVRFKPAELPALVVDRIQLTAFGVGVTAEYVFAYTDRQISRPCGSTDIYDPTFDAAKETVTLLTGLELPDGSNYAMPVSDYLIGDGVNCDSQSGHIRGMTLPTLGRLEWDYQSYAFPTESAAKPYLQRSTGVAKRRLKSAAGVVIGEWTYAPELRPLQSTPSNPKREQVVSLTTPLGHRSVHYFSAFVTATGFVNSAGWDWDEYGLPFTREGTNNSPGPFLSTEVYNVGGTKLRSTLVRYERDGVDDGHDSNRRQAASRVIFHDDGGIVAEESASDFDGLGHYRARTLFGTFPGSPQRSSRVEYNPERGTYGQGGYFPFPASSPWFIGRFVSSSETEGTQTLFRSFCFDATTGFLQGRRIHAANGGGLQTNDVVELFSPDARGNLASERSYGGDTQAVSADPTQGAICAMVTQPISPGGTTLVPVYQLSHLTTAGTRRRTTVSTAAALRLLDLTIDVPTGLPSASRDAAGIEEQFTYDTLGRLTKVEPVGDPVVADPTDALTTYTYCTATSVSPCIEGTKAEVVVARKTSVFGAEITALRYRFDDWGRLISEEERMPPSGTYQVCSTAYNALGWRTFVSEKGAPGGTSFSSFDPFGRPALVRPVDGAAHDVTLSYLGARQVQRTVQVAYALSGAETPATTTEVYDRFGRLYEVTEPNGVKTRYDYSAGNRLKKVCQNATGAGTATCGQARTFTYDNRGFLLWEQHPEKGTNGNGIVFYFSYDARGHARQRSDGPHDLTFTYDGAERLTEVRETGGLQRILKAFGYGTGTFSPDYSKGKLKTAKRFNYVGAPFNAKVEVRDTYLYGGRGGRASQNDTEMFFNDAPSEGFRQSPTWDNLGNLASQGYPDCFTGSCAALDTPRTVSFTYSYGRLATVPGFTGSATTTTGTPVNQITYHPSGVVFQVPHANQMLWTAARDLYGRALPSWFQASRGSTIYWNTGTPTYDGAGNLEGTGEFGVRYDTLSRVLQMSTIGGNSQSYTYDLYGNVQSVTTNSSTVGTPTSSATNHLSLGTYDGAGSLSSWAGNTYEHDAFGQLKRYVAGAEDWRYVYTAGDERFWSYRVGGGGSLWTLRGLDGQVLRRYESHVSWGTYEDYVYRDGQLLAAALTPTAPAPRTGMWHFHLDHLGTPRMVTNQNGGSLGFHRYYPFGQEETALQEGETRKFTGHERDLASLAGTADDLDYMHARHFSPLTARFVSTDAHLGAKRRPQSWNRYAYVRNGPLTFFDPSGEAAVYFTGWGNTVESFHRTFIAKLGASFIGASRLSKYQHVEQAAAFLAREYQKNPKQPLVILGHSKGATAALKTARILGNSGIPVQLVFTIDPTGNRNVPPNVKTAYNYFQPGADPGGGELRAESPATSVSNLSVGGTAHTALDDLVLSSEAIFQQILRLAQLEEEALATFADLQSASCFFTGACLPEQDIARLTDCGGNPRY